jgi:hypothetical protein
MKAAFILIFLLLSFVSKAQIKDITEQIKDTDNQKLMENIQKQDKVFEELESYLKEIGQQEFNASKDSINAVKYSKLLLFYNQLNANYHANYKAAKYKNEYRLVDDYIAIRLKRVDSLYTLFTSRRFEEKTPSVQPSENSVLSLNDTLVEKQPIYESCAGTPDEKLCTADFIRKKISNFFESPELREIGKQQLKSFVQFVINKKGEVVFASNSKSCGYFEYDMEFIRIFSTKFTKDKFIPAYQNGKNVNCRYAMPITIMVQ